MNAGHGSDQEQAAIWNGPGGRGWVELQEAIDQAYKPFEELMVEAASAARGGRILDAGCGAGGTTLAIARSRGAKAHCVGIDISEAMIAAARARAEREGAPATFICADAQTHAFDAAGFDMIVSRFGVMFFDDPVRAFANLRRAAADHAGLWFLAWRSATENAFMTCAEKAAAPLLPGLPPREPHAPGQFAFADDGRVRAILEKSGWAGIEIRPIDVVCTFAEKDLIPWLTHLGPVGRILQEADDGTRGEVVRIARAAFEPYVHGTEVRFSAACWTVSAHM